MQGGSGRGERVLRFGIASILISLLLFHFACTLLYLTPPNPIRIALHQPLERYMHPYFFQSWRLFAPDPGGKDGVVLVACRLRDGDTMQETALFDITTPLLEHRHRHRLSPGLLLVRAQKPRLFPVASPMNEAIRRYGLPSPVIEAARADLEAAAKRRFEAGKKHLYRIASAACDRRIGPARTTDVKARYVSRKVPPFGAQDSALSLEETNTYDFPWSPYEVVDGY